MKNVAALVAIVVSSCVTAGLGQDWLTYGGDSERTNWQRYERDLNKDNVKNLKLLWKRQLDNLPDGQNALTAPLILGPTITHRGIKELVFVAGASNNIYAVDADLGRLFWKRHIDTVPGAACGLGLTATPVLGPSKASGPRNNDDDPVQMRPLYVLASDGQLHTIRISTGLDMRPPMNFLPSNANASSLTLASRILSTSTPGNCGGAPNGVWSMDMSVPNVHVTFSPGKTGNASSAWKGNLVAGVTHLATREDATGTRWIYAAGKTAIEAFTVVEKDSAPKLTSVWTSRGLISDVAPVVVNGMVFALTDSTLFALDAATGKELYSSKNVFTAHPNSNGLAEANGHVCFGTRDNTLNCFGIPIETQ